MRETFRNRLLFDINTPSKLHHSRGTTEEEAMAFATELDHRGIHSSECQQSSARCQGVCEPLCGHWPWPYDNRGCQVTEAAGGSQTFEVLYRKTFLFYILFSKDP